MMRFILLFTLFFVFSTNIIVAQEYLEHTKWTKLLKKHVTKSGLVDYKGFVEDEEELDEYLAVLSKNHPDDSWKKNDRLAFWINTYNAFTVKLIVKNYPVKSIKDLGGSLYKINTAWDIKFIKIGNKTYDLNNIEHSIIRDEFEEPRIHFAVNCAAISCPKLRNEAYVGNKIDEQLDEQTKYFINESKKNKIGKKVAKISKIFSWYRLDFRDNGQNYKDFINQYSKVKITEDTKIELLNYDWSLNEKK